MNNNKNEVALEFLYKNPPCQTMLECKNADVYKYNSNIRWFDLMACALWIFVHVQSQHLQS